jgi:putative ABC transport system ATP-binding protein
VSSTPDTARSVLIRGTRRNGRLLGAGTALIAVFDMCEAIVPVLIGLGISRAVEPGDGCELVLWVAEIAAVYLVLTIAYRQGSRRLMLAIAREGHQLRRELSERILSPRGIKTDLRSGELLSITTTDADNVSYMLDYIPRIVGALVGGGVASAALMVIDIRLGLAVMVGTPLVLVVLQRISPIITRRVAEQQDKAAKATSLATDFVTGLRPLQGIGAEAAAVDRYRVVSQQSLRAALRAAVIQGRYLVASTASSALLACSAAILAGWFALTGRISIGEFITVIGLAQFLIEPISLLAIVPSWIAQAVASAERVARVLNAPPAVTTPPLPAHGATALDVRELTYRSLVSLDLRIAEGELVGVVTDSAEDADALVRVLGGLVDADDYEGEVRRHTDTLVEPHATDLFAGSLLSNLLPGGQGRSDVDDAALAHALEAAAALDVVAGHPDGLELVVVERGATLSGGQRQRIALARALLAKPRLLVLHDPTTAVDSLTEHEIAAGLRAVRHGSGGVLSTLILTTSPALLSVTDRVVVLQAGRIVEQGTHGEIADRSASYRQAVLR